MAKKPKMKKMAKGGTIKPNPKKGVMYEGLEQPLKKGRDDTAKMIGGIRSAKNKMPKRIKNLFPDI